jgi:predicted N-acetyltransferase YhbS
VNIAPISRYCTVPPDVGRGAPKRIPAILLAKLALRSDLHEERLAELLVYALSTLVTAARSAGERLVVVDTVDISAADFYRAHDFQPSRTDPCRLI